VLCPPFFNGTLIRKRHLHRSNEKIEKFEKRNKLGRPQTGAKIVEIKKCWLIAALDFLGGLMNGWPVEWECGANLRDCLAQSKNFAWATQ
jgi:hypothetical protein